MPSPQSSATETPPAPFAVFSLSLEKGIGFNYYYPSESTQISIDFRLYDNLAFPLELGNAVSFSPNDHTIVNYITEKDRVKEEIVMSAKPDSSDLCFSFQKGNLNVESRADGYHLLNAQNQEVFFLPNPTVVDASGRRGSISLTINGDLATLSIDQIFLDNAVYPVVIDPTVIGTWQLSGLGGSQVRDVAFSPNFANDRVAFAATNGQGIYKSSDGAANWQRTNSGISDLYLKAVAMSPNYSGDQTVFLGTTTGGIYKSTNGGSSWVSVGNSYASDAYSLAVSPNYLSDHTVFAGVYGYFGGVYKSTNSGSTWSLVYPTMFDSINSIEISRNFAADRTLFFGDPTGLYKSTDDGGTWVKKSNYLYDAKDIALSPNYASDQTLFVCSNNNGVYKSTDGGGSFVSERSGFSNLYTSSLAIDTGYTQNPIIFADIDDNSNAGVYQSLNGGQNWQSVNSGLGNTYIYDLAVSPNFDQDGFSLAGTAGGAYLVGDRQAPTVSITAPTGGATLTNSPVLIAGTAADNWSVSTVTVSIQRGSDSRYWNGSSWVSGLSWNAGAITSGLHTTSAAWQYSWNLPTDDGGSYTIQARATDGAGNNSTPASVSVAVDNTPPSPVSLNINSGATYTDTASATLNVSATGVSQMRFAESTAALSQATYVPYAASYIYTLSSANGSKMVYAQYKDAAGNETTPGAANTSHTIILDTVAPSIASVNPANNAINVSKDSTVSASFTEANAMDAATINSASFYLTDNNNATVTTSFSYDPTTKKATLTPSASLNPLTYTVHLTSAIKDAAGNALSPYSWSFSVGDQMPPDTVISDPTGGILTGSSKLITGSASDNFDVSIVTVAIQRQSDSLYWNGSSWATGPIWNTASITSGQHTTSASWQYSWGLPNDNGGSYIIQSKAIDGSDNFDPTPASVNVAVDNTPPTINSFSVSLGSPVTLSLEVTLDSSTTGASYMRFSESTSTLSQVSYAPYQSSASFELSTGDSTKTVYGQFKDAYGNESSPVAASIKLNTPLGKEDYFASFKKQFNWGNLNINLATGNLLLENKDMEVPSRGFPVEITRTFNSLSTETAAFGYGWTIGYNQYLLVNSDQSVTYTDDNGGKQLFAHNGDGSYSSPAGIDLTLTKTTDNNYPYRLWDWHEKQTLLFNSALKLAKIVDDFNNTMVINYSSGNISSVTNTSGKSTGFTYGANGKLQRITDPVSRTTGYTINAYGDLASFTDVAGRAVSYAYNSHRLTNITDYKGVTAFTYDSYGRIKTIADPRSTQQQPIVTTFDYYPGKTVVTDPLGKQTSYFYNTAGNLSSIIDAVGNTKNFTWQDNAMTGQDDVNSNLNLSYTSADLANFQYKIDASITGQISATYQNHVLISMTDANNLTTNISTSTISGTGRRVSTTDSRGKVLEKDYDPYGNLTKISNWHNPGTRDFASWYFTYSDAGDYLRFMTDPNGNVASYGYDTSDHSYQEINPRGNTTKYYLDSSSQSPGNAKILKLTDALTHDTTYTYDGSGNLSGIKDARGKITNFHYNSANLVDWMLNPLGKYTYLSYDLNGKPQSVNYPNGGSASYAYDDAGRLQTLSYSSAAATDTYQLNYQSGTNNLAGVTSGPGSYQFTYNNANWLTKVTDPFGLSQGYDYLPGGQLSRLKIGADSTATYAYQNNLLSSITDPFGRTSSFTYDERRNLISTKRPNNTTETVAYDAGNRTTNINQIIPGNGLNITYQYDKNNNVTTETVNGQLNKYAYDVLDRLHTWLDSGSNTTTYTYDPAGNLTQKGATTFGYNDANELTSDGSHNYTYDDNGNLLSDGVNTYSYDGANRLKSITTAAGTTSYTYDYLGRRITKTLPGGQTIDYHYLGKKLIAESDSTGTIATYAYTDKGRLYSITRSGQTYYYHLNSRGDVLVLTGSSGNVVAQYTYDPWGSVLSATGSLAAQPFRYASYYYDSESDMYYLMARYYKPSISRFITQDPKPGDPKKPITFNFYAYGNDNPNSFTDARGRVGEAIVEAAPTIGEVLTGIGIVLAGAFPEISLPVAGLVVVGTAVVSGSIYAYVTYKDPMQDYIDSLVNRPNDIGNVTDFIPPGGLPPGTNVLVKAVLRTGLGASAFASIYEQFESYPNAGGSPSPTIDQSLPISGLIYNSSSSTDTATFSFYANSGVGYVNFDHQWDGFGHTLGLIIRDSNGVSVFNYNGGWGGRPYPPIQNSKIYFRVPGEYKVAVFPASWTVNWPWPLWMWFNGIITYPALL